MSSEIASKCVNHRTSLGKLHTILHSIEHFEHNFTTQCTKSSESDAILHKIWGAGPAVDRI